MCCKTSPFVDKLNHTGNQAWFAGQGIAKDWKIKRDMLSPAYATNRKKTPKLIIK
ncbi:DUF4113 domain-containing protein [Buttiauxella sp. B2]|uniref:DUF4113 domain-containing protein n=1 Tax=Buttiauxella sp. B2 TaxID=2587812 RepID=UPI003519E369